MKQEIISYRKIIKPERSTLRVLERRVESFLPEELEEYFDDIVDSAERIWDLLDNYKEVVEALESTNESVLAHRFNDVLRILTVFSIVFLPATLIASLWGMNVGLPGRRRAVQRLAPRVLGDHRGERRRRRRDDRVLPLEALARRRRSVKRPGPPPHRGPGHAAAARLEENSERCLGRTAALRERGRVVKIDLDMRGKHERRPDVVPGAHELFETPAEDHFCLGLVDQFELGRSHCASLFVYDYWVTVERHRPAVAPA